MQAVIFAALALTTTAATALDAKDMAAEKRVSALDSVKFCKALGSAARLPVGKDEAYRAAMLRRAEKSERITPPMISAIQSRKPVLGMNLCSVIAAFGSPTRSNHTVTRYSDGYQLIYERPRMYLYVDLKKDDYYLTSWQD